MGKCSKDRRDVYYRLAKEEGWRARSAFKLMQINHNFQIFDSQKPLKIIDLCGAPGSWSQAISSRLAPPNSKIVTVDMQPIAPLEGVSIIQGDITSSQTWTKIKIAMGDDKADIIVCDGAPDVTGLHDMDEFIQHRILLSALSICKELLREGGQFVGKIFRGANCDIIYDEFRSQFKRVYLAKPKSSRVSSIEAFVVAKDYDQNHECIKEPIEFTLCGRDDDLDCDTIRSLPSDYIMRDVVQPPIR